MPNFFAYDNIRIIKLLGGLEKNMLKETIELLKKTYRFSDETLNIYEKAIKDVEEEFKMYDKIR